VVGEEALSRAEHRREHHEAVLVNEVVVDQRMHHTKGAGGEDVLVGLAPPHAGDQVVSIKTRFAIPPVLLSERDTTSLGAGWLGVGPYRRGRILIAMTVVDFETRIEPHRRELLAYCYRMVGSVHEAEDLVQETMLRAWKARERYDERRASPRTWLYRIATNLCLTALEGKARRPLPSGLGAPSTDPESPLRPAFDVPWLQPFPDARLGDAEDPEARAVQRGGMRLALIAAMQLLPPRQRAVWVLREVLQFSAAETADLLGTSVTSVNSTLQRARAGLPGAPLVEDEIAQPNDRAARETVDTYVRAFEAADVDALVELLIEDAVLEMPPVPLWYLGRDHYGDFIRRVFAMRGVGWRMTPTAANGQPAVAAYVPDPDGGHRLHTLQVFTVTGAKIAHTVVFQDPAVFAAFGLPAVLS
jgi:RNA polymerase sigma-70 factor, ECF subfamily